MTISRNFSSSWDLKIQISLLRVTILISSSSLFFQKRSVLWQVWLLHQGYIAEPSAGSAAAVARKNWHYFPSLHARPIERTHHRRQRSAKVEIFRFPGRQTNNYPDPRLLGWECKYDDVGNLFTTLLSHIETIIGIDIKPVCERECYRSLERIRTAFEVRPVEVWPRYDIRLGLEETLLCWRLTGCCGKTLLRGINWPLPKRAGSWLTGPNHNRNGAWDRLEEKYSIHQSRKKCRGSTIFVYLAAQTATIVAAMRYFCLAFLLVLSLQTIPSAFALLIPTQVPLILVMANYECSFNWTSTPNTRKKTRMARVGTLDPCKNLSSKLSFVSWKSWLIE